MELEIFTVDSFSDRPFAGNPAAVCLVRRDVAGRLDDATMTKIAAEMNLSETAFVAEDDANNKFETGSEFGLRWFTPTCEVNLCGHATLATSAVLFHKLGNPHGELRFRSKSGILTAAKNGEEITLNFPLNPCTPVEGSSRTHIQPLVTAAVGSATLADVQYSPTTKKLLLRFPDTFTRTELENLPVDPQKLVSAPQQGEIQVKGVILTVRGTEYDFVSRYFAPWVGIPEDPVTGAAHTVLASYWSEQLGKKQLLARQCSARGGDVRVEVGEEGRVCLSGRAYIVMKGQLMI